MAPVGCVGGKRGENGEGCIAMESVGKGRNITKIHSRPVARMSNLHKHTKLGGSGGMLPQEMFRNEML